MTSRRTMTTSLACMAGLLGLSLLAACGGSGGGPGQADPEVMFVSACPDGSLKVFMNDTDQSGTLAFKGSKTFVKFLFDEVDPVVDVSVEEPDRSTSYDSQSRTFDRDSSTIVVAVGIKNPPDTEIFKRLRPTFIAPNRTAPIGNRSRLIFLHAFNRKSPFNTPPLVLKTAGDTPLFSTPNTEYGNTNSVDVDSGTYKFFGVDDPRNNFLQAKDPDAEQIYAENKNPAKPVVLAPGKVYLVMAAGQEAANSVPGELVFVEVPIDPDN